VIPRTHRSVPGACTQTPISAWLASVPTVPSLRNYHRTFSQSVKLQKIACLENMISFAKLITRNLSKCERCLKCTFASRPDGQFEAEPGVADALCVEESAMRLGRLAFQHPARTAGGGRCLPSRRGLAAVAPSPLRGGAPPAARDLVVDDRRKSPVKQTGVANDRDLHRVMCLEAEREDRHDHKQHGHQRYNLQQYMRCN